MLGFWLIAGGMTLAAVAFVAARLVFPPRASFHVAPREANLAALRAAWAELERDRSTGLISADQYEAARTELASRADEELDEASAPSTGRPARITAALAALLIPFAALGLYRQIGSPEAIDKSQAFASLEGPLTSQNLPAYRDQLARHVADNPRDGRAWAILGRVDLSLDHFADAEMAFGRAVQDRKVALDPGIWCDYADAAGMAQGGKLAGKPAELVAKALSLDPAHPRALEMAGSLAWEQGDFAAAAAHWKRLLPLIAGNDPARRELEAAIARAERRAPPGISKPG
jgi:cytochrome c-type biogenesis protein CcmH